MFNLRGREFCFWVVPGQNGRVRKVRLSARTIAALTLVTLAISSGLILVASDYARVQVLRATNYLHLRMVSAERDRLISTKESLESRLQSLMLDNRRVASYEKQVRGRLDELASLLRSANTFRPLPEVLPSKDLEPSALGGESGCGKDGCSNGKGGEVPLGKSELRASLNPSFLPLLPNSGIDEQPNQDLIEVLDSYIEILRFMPIGFPVNGTPNSGFGSRFSPFGDGLAMHEGVDFALPLGSLVTATADGVIRDVRFCPTYGLMVDIVHNDHVVTRYAHLSKAFVSLGEKICKGEVLGLVGSTGRSTGPHLHYEVQLDGKARDPEPYLMLASRLTKIFG